MSKKSEFLNPAQIELLRKSVGEEFFRIFAHNASLSADTSVVESSGITIEINKPQSAPECPHIGFEYWEDEEDEDHYRLIVQETNSYVHPVTAAWSEARDRIVKKDKTPKELDAPQYQDDFYMGVYFFNKGALVSIDVYRGSPNGDEPDPISDTLLIFNHAAGSTFAIKVSACGMQGLMISFSKEIICEWKKDYSKFDVLS
ncbi:MAG: hypothetical protein ABIJ96_14900 [Elusimicrobiota bacterium]